MDVFNLIILVVLAVFVVKVIWRYRQIKKEMREGVDDQS